MRVVIAPDKFKGSLEAPAVAAAIAAGFATVQPATDLYCQPVADGGEGTVAAAVAAGFQPITVTVTGPVGNPVPAAFAVSGTRAVIEMSAASGMLALPSDASGGRVPDPLGASSIGTGELIRAALDRGCRDIVLGVGGSATTDGGSGMLVGLGAELLDATGRPVRPGGGGLAALATVSLSGLDSRLAGARFVLAADVTNPLLGTHGAATVFGPQKGASSDEVAELEANLTRFAALMADVRGAPATQAMTAATAAAGAGAAGGVGYAAILVLGAQRRSGVEVVLELVGLADQLAGVGLVVTGEGSLDGQSLDGKAPIGVARLARAHGVPRVVAVCGRRLIGVEAARMAGFDDVIALIDRQPDPARAMAEAPALLAEVGAELARRYAG